MDILFLILMFLPLGVVLWLAHFSWRKRIEGDLKSERVFKLLAYGLLAVLFDMLILAGLLLQVTGLVATMMPAAAEALPRVGLGL